MHVIIYGKENCINCDKSKMLCQIKSIDFQFRHVGNDISVEDLHEKVGHPVHALPQIFLTRDATTCHVGGYDELRAALSPAH